MINVQLNANVSLNNVEIHRNLQLSLPHLSCVQVNHIEYVYYMNITAKSWLYCRYFQSQLL